MQSNIWHLLFFWDSCLNIYRETKPLITCESHMYKKHRSLIIAHSFFKLIKKKSKEYDKRKGGKLYLHVRVGSLYEGKRRMKNGSFSSTIMNDFVIHVSSSIFLGLNTPLRCYGMCICVVYHSQFHSSMYFCGDFERAFSKHTPQ